MLGNTKKAKLTVRVERGADPYLPEHAQWLKVRNHSYSKWVGREELFEHERASDPDFRVWDGCALACNGL